MMLDLQLLTRREVAELIRVNPSTIWRWIKSGDFPAGIPVGKSGKRWRHCDVQQWLVVRANTGLTEPRNEGQHDAR